MQRRERSGAKELMVQSVIYGGRNYAKVRYNGKGIHV